VIEGQTRSDPTGVPTAARPFFVCAEGPLVRRVGRPWARGWPASQPRPVALSSLRTCRPLPALIPAQAVRSDPGHPPRSPWVTAAVRAPGPGPAAQQWTHTFPEWPVGRGPPPFGLAWGRNDISGPNHGQARIMDTHVSRIARGSGCPPVSGGQGGPCPIPNPVLRAAAHRTPPLDGPGEGGPVLPARRVRTGQSWTHTCPEWPGGRAARRIRQRGSAGRGCAVDVQASETGHAPLRARRLGGSRESGRRGSIAGGVHRRQPPRPSGRPRRMDPGKGVAPGTNAVAAPRLGFLAAGRPELKGRPAHVPLRGTGARRGAAHGTAVVQGSQPVFVRWSRLHSTTTTLGHPDLPATCPLTAATGAASRSRA
jgi:hypothetical protein